MQFLGFQHDLHLRDLDTYTRAPTCTITDADIGIDIDALGVYSWCLLLFCCLGRSLEAQGLYFICVIFRVMRNEDHTQC